MNYIVDWVRTPKKALLAIWLAAPDQAEIARTANFIERLLTIDPHREGKPIPRSYRTHFVTPLTVKFKINDATKTVTIVDVRFGKQPF